MYNFSATSKETMSKQKKIAEDTYKIALDILIERFYIPGVTYLSQVDYIGKKLFGDDFVGVFPADEQPTLKNGQMCIMNLDRKGLPGSHWIALGQDKDTTLIYDSFGRPSKDIYKTRGKTKDTEYDAEQDEAEDNCGARSLAWCYVFKTLGPRAAEYI